MGPRGRKAGRFAARDRVYEVALEVKLVIHATTHEDAGKVARDAICRVPEFSSVKVTNVFCPAEGQ